MRYGIVSDIHANLAAFEAVLADMGKVDNLLCLGDLVGYGPDPNECVELLRSHAHRCVVGNHDLAAVGRLDISRFNRAAADAVKWTAQTLSESSRDYLIALPQRVVEGDFTLVHGSPRRPIWEYIDDDWVAAPNLEHFDTPACLVGHTHVPALYGRGAKKGVAPEGSVQIGERKLIVNPGSVGQPRDRDPRAAYALYDDETHALEWRRVDYAIDVTQRRMRDAGLPPFLIHRLKDGQ